MDYYRPPKSVTKPKWIQDVKPKGKIQGTDVLTMKESGPNRKPHVPKICPAEPRSRIQFQRGWTSAESHGTVRYTEDRTGKGKGKGRNVTISHTTKAPQHNIAVKVQEGWCLPLNPPIHTHRAQDATVHHQDDNAQPNKRNRTEPIAPSVPPPKKTKPSQQNGDQRKEKSAVPKTSSRGWDMDKMFKNNPKSKWANLSADMKRYGGGKRPYQRRDTIHLVRRHKHQ